MLKFIPKIPIYSEVIHKINITDMQVIQVKLVSKLKDVKNCLT